MKTVRERVILLPKLIPNNINSSIAAYQKDYGGLEACKFPTFSRGLNVTGSVKLVPELSTMGLG